MSRRAPLESMPTWRFASDAPMPAKGSFVMLVPGEDAPLHMLDLPEALRETVRQKVARTQIEGVLRDGLDSVELRVSPPRPDGIGAAVIVDVDRARSWRNRVNDTSGRVRAILPDYMALPDPKDGWHIHAEPAANGTPRILARLGPVDGFAAPLPHAMAQIRAALRANGAPSTAHVSGNVPDAVISILNDAGCPPVPLSDVPDAAGSRISAQTVLAFDLLGDPAAERSRTAAALRQWTTPALLCTMGAVAIAAGLWIDTMRLTNAATQRRDATIAIARESFIPNGPILDLRQQVGRVISERQSATSATKGDDGPIDAFYKAAAPLSADGVTLRRIQQSPGTALTAEVEVANFAALDALTARIAATGLRSRVVSSSVGGTDGVSAILALGPTPGAGQ